MNFVLLILAFLHSAASDYNIKELRLEYYRSVEDKNIADALYKKLQGVKNKDATLLAYLGSVEAVRAKHSINPYNKISYLKSGTGQLARAVALEPENLEIRFLRFTLEHYVPAFLGQSKHLEADRQKIVELIKKKKVGQVDAPLLKNIVSFMKESKRCTAAEIEQLNKAVNG